MKRMMTVIMTGVLLSATAVGCGGDDEGSDDRLTADELAEMFVSSGAPEAEADCMANELVDQFSREEFQVFIDSDDGSDVPEDLMAAVGIALGECT